MKSGVDYRYQRGKAISIDRQLVRGWISLKVKIDEPVSFPINRGEFYLIFGVLS